MTTTTELAAEAFTLEQRIRAEVKEIRARWITLAQMLFTFNEQSSWQLLGYESFDEWLAQPHIDIPRSSAYKLMAMYREYVVKLGAAPEELAAFDQSKLAVVLPAIRRGKIGLKTALVEAEQLSWRDLNERYGSQRRDSNGAGPDTSTHYDAESEPAWTVCPKCGSRVRETELARA
jgi:hypothetical protein